METTVVPAQPGQRVVICCVIDGHENDPYFAIEDVIAWVIPNSKHVSAMPVTASRNFWLREDSDNASYSWWYINGDGACINDDETFESIEQLKKAVTEEAVRFAEARKKA